MYIHRYIAGDTFYRISSEPSKPSGTVTLGSKNWEGRISGSSKISSALDRIADAFKNRKVEEETPEEEKKGRGKKRALSETICAFVASIQE